MATASAPLAEPQASISPLGRLIGVIFSPKSTFADIVRKPSWLLPVILLAVLGTIVAVGLNQKMDWREYISQQIARVRRARLTQDLLGPTAFDKLADAHDRDPRG